MKRDPTRIKRITDLIRNIWKDNPDLRFYQLVELITPKSKGKTNFYIEDDELEVILKAHLNNSKKTSKMKTPEL
jgi:hypothetical protein